MLGFGASAANVSQRKRQFIAAMSDNRGEIEEQKAIES